MASKKLSIFGFYLMGTIVGKNLIKILLDSRAFLKGMNSTLSEGMNAQKWKVIYVLIALDSIRNLYLFSV